MAYRLHFGWSARSRQIDSAAKRPQQRAANSTEPISQAEQERVIKVIQRAEEISENEQRRIGYFPYYLAFNGLAFIYNIAQAFIVIDFLIT